MSRRKSNLITADNFDSKTVYSTVIAIVLISFIVRLKVFNNFVNYDGSTITHMANFYTHYRLIGMIIVASALLLSLIYKIYRYKEKLTINYVLLGVGLIIVAAFISVLQGEELDVAIWGLYSRTNGLLAYVSLFLLIFCITNLKIRTNHVTFLVNTVNIASIILVIIGVFQFFNLDIMNSLWFKQLYTPNEYKHLIGNINIASHAFYGTQYFWASSILAQFNYFGAYCSVVYPLITVFALNEQSMIKKLLLMLGSIMLFTGTILAQSMGSIIAVIIVLSLIPISVVNRHNYKSFLIMCIGYAAISMYINRLTIWVAFSEMYKLTMQIINSKLLYLVILMAIVYILLFAFRKKISKYRYLLVSALMIFVILTGTIAFIYFINNVAGQNMAILSSRGYIWHYANEVIKEHYLFGVGPDNFFYNFPQINPDKSAYAPDVFIDKPHNMYLQVMADTGIFGLIGFMILLVGLLLKSNKKIDVETDPYKKTYSKALILVIIAYMIQGMVNDNHMVVQPILYLILGVGAALTTAMIKSNDISKTNTIKK